MLSSDGLMFMVIEDQHAVLCSKHPSVQEICLIKNSIIFAFNSTSKYYQMKSADRHTDCEFLTVNVLEFTIRHRNNPGLSRA